MERTLWLGRDGVNYRRGLFLLGEDYTIFDSLAILQTEVDRALGHLDTKYLSPEDVTAAAMETLSFYGLDSAQSPHGRTSKHVTFYPTSRDAPVNKASDMAIPSYVERRVGHVPNNEWVWIPATHPSALSEFVERRCAWYSDQNKARLMLNYDPTGIEHRLWYTTDPVIARAMGDPLGLPTRYGFLFLHATILNAVTTVMNRAAQLPEDEQLDLAQLNAISAQVAHSQAQVKKWEEKRRIEVSAERAPRGRDRRNRFAGVQF